MRVAEYAEFTVPAGNDPVVIVGAGGVVPAAEKVAITALQFVLALRLNVPL